MLVSVGRMDLRITLREDRSVTVVGLHGSFVDEAVPEFSRVIEALGGCWRLDLSELRSLDAEGVAVLRGLRGAGIAFLGMSPYIALCLGAPSDVAGEPAPAVRVPRTDRER